MKYGQFVGAVADIFDLDHADFMQEAAILLDPLNRELSMVTSDHTGFMPPYSVDDEDAAKTVLLAIAFSMKMFNGVTWAHSIVNEQDSPVIANIVKAIHHEEKYEMACCFGAIIADINVDAEIMTAVRDLYAPVAAKPAKPALRAVN